METWWLPRIYTMAQKEPGRFLLSDNEVSMALRQAIPQIVGPLLQGHPQKRSPNLWKRPRCIAGMVWCSFWLMLSRTRGSDMSVSMAVVRNKGYGTYDCFHKLGSLFCGCRLDNSPTILGLCCGSSFCGNSHVELPGQPSVSGGNAEWSF